MIQKNPQEHPSCPQLKSLVSFHQDYKKMELIVQHLRTENIEADDRQPIEQSKENSINNNQHSTKKSERQNIALTIALAEQNQELARKIEVLKRQIEDEQLKARIFSDNMQKNQKEISRLREKKEELLESQKNSLRMETLNESHIPNKSAEFSTTLNTNLWMNEFMNKEELENLWSAKRQKTAKNVKAVTTANLEQKVRCFTIDLSAHMKKQKEKALSKLSCSSSQQKEGKIRSEKPEKTKKTIVSVAHNAKGLAGRLDLKMNLQQKSMPCNQPSDKSKALNKAISSLRNAKKLRPNPQL